MSETVTVTTAGLAGQSPPDALELLQETLVTGLAEYLDVGKESLVHAVESVTADWSVEVHHMRPVTDPYDRFTITTPWVSAR